MKSIQIAILLSSFLGVVVFLHRSSSKLLSVEHGWENAFDQEASEDRRFSRFIGFIEGRFGVKVPNSWKESKAITPPHDEKSIVIDKLLHSKARLVLKTTDSPSELSIEMIGDGGSQLWAVEPFSLFPKLMSGPARLWVDIEEDESSLYLFGRMGDARFFQVISKSDGHILVHFGFLLDRRVCLGGSIDT